MTKTVTFTLSGVNNFRKIYESKDGFGAMYGATCPIVDIFAAREKIDSVTSINPRNQKETSGPSKAMRLTLKDAQNMFVFRNRGMTFMAYDASWDNKTNELTLTFKLDPTSENETDGLIDGGHSYEVIKNFVSEIEEAQRKDITAEVRLDIITGFEGNSDEVNEIVEARNTSTQVKDETLLNSKGVFDLIKEALVGTSYGDNISYYENQYKDEANPNSGYRTIKVSTVLSYIMCFDGSVFSENSHPTQAYSSKKKAIAWYEDKWQNNKNDLSALLGIAKEILELRDYIESQIPIVWNKISGRYADQNGVNKFNQDTKLDFTNYTVRYDVPGGHVYPLLAAFRSLLVKEKDVYRFKTSPKELFDTMNLDDQRSLIYKIIGAEDQDPQKIGKSRDLYDSCYGSLRGYYYESLSK